MCENKLARERVWLQGGDEPRLGLRLGACTHALRMMCAVCRGGAIHVECCPLCILRFMECWHKDSRREQRQRPRWFAQLFCSAASGTQCPALVPSAQHFKSSAPAPTACISSSSNASAQASAASTNARTSASASAAGDGRRAELQDCRQRLI